MIGALRVINNLVHVPIPYTSFHPCRLVPNSISYVSCSTSSIVLLSVSCKLFSIFVSISLSGEVISGAISIFGMLSSESLLLSSALSSYVPPVSCAS